MKVVVTVLVSFLVSFSAVAGVGQNLVATCVRADSGDSPEVKVYSNKENTHGLVMLNTYDGREFFIENTTVNVRGSYDVFNGVDVSIAISTQLETKTERFPANIVIHANTDNIVPWLQVNSNYSNPKLGFEDVEIDLTCEQVN